MRGRRCVVVSVWGVLCAAAASAACADEATAAPSRPAIEGLLPDAKSSDGTTALHWAAHNGDADLVKRLLKAGANAKTVNDYGASPMSEAAELGNAEIIEAL